MTYQHAIASRVSVAVASAISDAIAACIPPVLDPLCDWLDENIPTPNGTALILEPWQRDPIEFLDGQGDRELTVVAPEQIGKSEIWRRYLFGMLARDPSDTWIVYESDRKAEDVNRATIIPTLRQMESIAKAVETPGTIRKDGFFFPRATVHFSGSGAPVTTHSKRVVIADEVDFWTGLTNDQAQDKQSTKAARNVDNLANLRKRTRTYRGRRKIIQVSSPTLESGPIWRAFLRGSRSYWCLACLKCGAQLRSCDTWMLQFERDEDGTPLDSSIRLACPKCKHEHEEKDSWAMNDRASGADWEHQHPESLAARSKHMSVQIGALACPRAIAWDEIAQAIVDGGKSGSLEHQKILDNTYRGLPLQKRKAARDGDDLLALHSRPLPDPSELRAILMSADTQDDGWYVVHRGIDDAGNMYGLRAVFAATIDELSESWDWEWNGITAMAGIVDEGGHRAYSDVVPFMLSRPGMYTYKGETAVRELCGWKVSDAADRRKRLLLANPYQFQELLLWLMYQHTDPNDPGFWCLPPQENETAIEGMHAEYIAQVSAMASNSRKKYGNEYRNWDSGGKPDHFFDAEKMWLVLLDYALTKIPPRFWRGGRLPTYYIDRLRAEAARRRKRTG